MKKSEIIRIVFFVVLFVVGVSISYRVLKSGKKLKIYNPAELNSTLVDSSMRTVSKMHRTADFEFISQSGTRVTQRDFDDKIFVTDFFFTTCGSICPKMSVQMQRVYEEFEDEPDVLFLSHTVMPEVDSVPVLQAYAKELGADESRWKFVTGPREEIFRMARKSYFAVTDEGNAEEGDFVHTENFVLVDRQRRLRGFYDGTSTEDVDRLIDDLHILLEEK